MCNDIFIDIFFSEYAEDLNEAWGRCPVKHTIDEYMTSLEQLQKVIIIFNGIKFTARQFLFNDARV